MSGGAVREWAKLARRAFALVEESGDPALYDMAVARTVYAFFSTGEYREAVAICDRTIELSDGEPTASGATSMGRRYAFCHMFKGFVLVQLGELEEARQLIDLGRRLAREQGDLETVGWSHSHATWLAYFAGEYEAMPGIAQQLFEITERIGDSYQRAWAWFHVGWAERMRGEWRAAIEALERSLEITSERRTAVEAEAFRLIMLGESHLGLGDAERARALVGDGLEIAKQQGFPFNETHASLALARVLLHSADPAARAEIDAALARTMELARDRREGVRAAGPC
jgi:tetratricopeptide (TPR) repeat protein